MKITAFVLTFILTLPSSGQEITVAAAADLRSALNEITSHFQRETSVHVKVVYGSSGNLFQQIQNGAPFDLFFSANSEYPKKLEAAGLSVTGSYYEYARGHIVLLTFSTSSLDLQRGLKVLLDGTIRRIAIADPSHAPYGQAAVAALQSQGLYDQISRKLVLGENVAQATSFVTSGAADIGIVAKSLAVLPSARGKIRFTEIPVDEYPPIEQICILLRSSKEQEAARRFLTYIQGPDATKILQQYGFDVPSTKAAHSIQ
ncbi:MAG: molybdate ABC transporter substrate-binding protein [Terriglobales bacterium]